jgi:hypothetical protein
MPGFCARLPRCEIERFGMGPVVMLSQGLAEIAGPVSDGAVTDLAAGGWKMGNGHKERREGDLLITSMMPGRGSDLAPCSRRASHAADADIRARRVECINIQPSRLPDPRGRDFQRCRELLITAHSLALCADRAPRPSLVKAHRSGGSA